MSSFVYLLAEGVTDVTLITRVLRRYLSMSRIKARSDLPDRAKTWLDSFRWPVGGDIARPAVPAPVFMQRAGVLVAIRNAQGLDQIRTTLDADNEALVRIDWRPDALGILLDADNKKIENVLLPLGELAFPELHDASQGFVESWNHDHGNEAPFTELRKPAGLSKAQLSTMAALLKPGKNLNASLQDQEWVPTGRPPDVLKPLFDFLQALVGKETT